MAEKEQNMRHDTTGKIIDKEFSLRSIGQWLAVVALLMLLATVAYIAFLGDTKSAAWLGAATIGAVVSVFVTGRWFDAAETEGEPPLPQAPAPKGNAQKQLPRNSRSKRR